MARKKLVAGNWKMNSTLAEAKALATAVGQGVGTSTAADVVVCPPYPWLVPVHEALKGSSVGLGAQDVSNEPKGAFTGEVSTTMLKEAGCKYVVLGHSERRHVLGESDVEVHLKLHAAVEAGMHVILCMGETLIEREKGLAERVFQRQVYSAVAGITDEQWSRIIIAYEPVWAIGTGKTATPDQAQNAHYFIRTKIRTLHGEKIANALPILYGGSVTPDTAAGLFSQPDVDGGLVGGASLKADQFLAIVKAASAS